MNQINDKLERIKNTLKKLEFENKVERHKLEREKEYIEVRKVQSQKSRTAETKFWGLMVVGLSLFLYAIVDGVLKCY